MIHVASISLGSSSRDKQVVIKMREKEILVDRIGVDGDERRAAKLFAEMDGKVHAFGLGGAELNLQLGERSYPLVSGRRIIRAIRKTPVADGGGVRQIMEANILQKIERQLDVPITTRKAMLTAGVDRYYMAYSLHQAGFQIVFCDFMFGLGIPIAVYGMRNLLRLGKILLPIVRRLPIRMIYPIGKSQDEIIPKYERWYHYGSVIAGDFLQIRRHLPASLEDQIVITNTTTQNDVDLLQERGLKYLITTTPVYNGRSFGTNVLEAILIAYSGIGRALTGEEIADLMSELKIEPTLRKLNT